MLLKKKYPIAYPATPPSTEENVQINAYTHALILLAITIGIRSMSGGIGKKELSANETKLSIHEEYLCSALLSVQLYKDFKSFIYLVGVEGIEPTPPK